MSLTNGEIVVEKQNRNSMIILGTGVLAAIVLLVSQGPDMKFWTKKIQAWSGATRATVENQSPAYVYTENEQSIAADVAGSIGDQDPVQLNRLGVALVAKKKLWEGVAAFDQAIQRDPSGIIPIINMAVVLTEMGLTRPAERYVAMAEVLQPNNSWLQKNFRRKEPSEK